MAQRGLSSDERRRLAILGLPTLGLTLSITIVSTYLPKVAQSYTDSTVLIGLVVGGEGVMALWVPLVVGPWSDQLRTRLGGRLPFLLGATPPLAAALVLVGVAGSLAGIAIAAAVFFVAYFIAYEPYRAMYPDLIRDEAAGRAQGTQAVWRGLGTSVALVSGGLLLSLAAPAPFAVAAAVMVATTVAFAWFVVRRGLATTGGDRDSQTPAALAIRLRDLIATRPALRAYLVANGLWELALAALKAFAILYVTDGLGYSLVFASLAVGGVGLIVLGGAIVAGQLGDRIGRLVVVRRSLWVYGIGLLIPGIVTFEPVIAIAAPLIAFGGGAMMALAYAVLIPLMPEEDRGALTGFYSVSRGLGITIGPVIAGAAIALTAGSLFEGTAGYQATWLVCAAAILLSLPFVRRLEAASSSEEPG